MSGATDTSKSVLQDLWSSQGDPSAALDEDCSPTKTCRNMRGVSFDAYAEGDADPATAWRRQLERDGKLDASAGSVRDLVFGEDSGR